MLWGVECGNYDQGYTQRSQVAQGRTVSFEWKQSTFGTVPPKIPMKWGLHNFVPLGPPLSILFCSMIYSGCTRRPVLLLEHCPSSLQCLYYARRCECTAILRNCARTIWRQTLWIVELWNSSGSVSVRLTTALRKRVVHHLHFWRVAGARLLSCNTQEYLSKTLKKTVIKVGMLDTQSWISSISQVVPALNQCFWLAMAIWWFQSSRVSWLVSWDPRKSTYSTVGALPCGRFLHPDPHTWAGWTTIGLQIYP